MKRTFIYCLLLILPLSASCNKSENFSSEASAKKVTAPEKDSVTNTGDADYNGTLNYNTKAQSESYDEENNNSDSDSDLEAYQEYHKELKRKKEEENAAGSDNYSSQEVDMTAVQSLLPTEEELRKADYDKDSSTDNTSNSNGKIIY